MNQEQLDKIREGSGFIAALDLISVQLSEAGWTVVAWEGSSC